MIPEIKFLNKSCAPRATATPKQGLSSPPISDYVAELKGANNTETEVSSSVNAVPAMAEAAGPEVLAYEIEVDPRWRQKVHLRPDASCKSSLEHCIKE